MNNKSEIQNFSFQEVFSDENNCPRETEVFRYFQGLLDEESRLNFEKHLKTCDYCAQRHAELSELNKAIENVSLDPKVSKDIFEKNRTRLRGYLEVKYGGIPTKPDVVARGWQRAFHFPAYLNALMLLLVAGLIYPTYRSFILNQDVNRLEHQLAAKESNHPRSERNYEKEIQDLRRERESLMEPQLSGSAVYSVRRERGVQPETIDLTFSHGEKQFGLVFALSGLQFKTYTVEILRNQQRIWWNDAHPSGSNPLISIQLHSDYFQNGEYALRIEGKNENENSLLAEYRLRISRED